MAKRANGDGSITWLSTTKVLLRVTVDGRQRSKTATVRHQKHGGKGEAEAALEAFKVEVRTPTPTKSEWTLRALIEDYATSRERIGKARSTVESYRFVGRRLTDDLGSKPLDEITPDDVDAFYGDLAARNLKSATIRHTHAVLVAAMNFAVEKKRVAENVILRATPPDKVKSPKRRIEPGDADLLIQVAAASVERTFELDGGRSVRGEGDEALAMAIFLATYFGGRRGELCGLRWGDFDPRAGTLRFERQWVPGTGGQYLADLKSDTGSIEGVRTVYLGMRTVDVLERWRIRQAGPGDGWIVSHDGDTPMRAKALGEAITRLGKKLGIKVTTHSFRRTSSTQMVAAGIDVDTAARRSGHTREVMLAHYVQGADDKAVEAAVALEDRLVGQGMAIEGYLAAAQ